MSHKLVLATRNQGKITEFRRILEELAPGQIELIGVDQFPNLVDVDETGSTFEENSLLKARYTCEATGIPAIADDSGLCVDALNGDPGIFSARWAGDHGNDRANIDKVLEQLKDVPDQLRTAHFMCVASLVFTLMAATRLQKVVLMATSCTHPWARTVLGMTRYFSP
jgi:XTP/dITP diphosphohydrolase